MIADYVHVTYAGKDGGRRYRWGKRKSEMLTDQFPGLFQTQSTSVPETNVGRYNEI